MDTAPDYRFLPTTDPVLSAIFEGVWSLVLPAPAEEEMIAPDGCCEIIFHATSPPHELRGDASVQQPATMLYGPLTQVLRLRPQGPMRMVAIRLAPWGIGALHDTPSELRNRAVDLRTFLGSDLAAALAKLSHEATLDAFADKALPRLKRAARLSPAFEAVRQAGQLAQAAPDSEIADLIARSACSQRTLSRRFLRQCGLNPGEFLRLNRFQRARAAIKSGQAGLADIAADSGYADQAHMTREFRRLTGITPAAMRLEAGFDPLYED